MDGWAYRDFAIGAYFASEKPTIAQGQKDLTRRRGGARTKDLTRSCFSNSRHGDAEGGKGGWRGFQQAYRDFAIGAGLASEKPTIARGQKTSRGGAERFLHAKARRGEGWLARLPGRMAGTMLGRAGGLRRRPPVWVAGLAQVAGDGPNP
jgi:hypothetical protein